MFLTAKLIGIATGILSLGTITPISWTYFQDSNWTNNLYKQDSSFSKYNFKTLDEEADQKLKILNEKFKRLLLAESSAKFLKNIEFQKIQAFFQSISQSEEKLKKLFETITKSFNELLEKNKQTKEAQVKKLEEEKQQKLQQEIQKSYSKLKESLEQWEKHLKEINCFIEKKEETTEQQCQPDKLGKSSFIDSASSFLSLLLEKKQDSSPAPPAIGGGAKKAQEDLKKVQESLSQTIQEIQRKNGVYSLSSSYAWYKEKMATIKHIYQVELLKVLAAEIAKLNESIKKDSKETSNISKEINGLNKKLKNSYSYFSSLKTQESIFHNWKEKFNEQILKNESDKLREMKLSA